MIGRLKTPYIIIGPSKIPFWYQKREAGRWLDKICDRIKHMNLWNSAISRIPPRFLSLPYANYAISTCSESLLNNSLVGAETKLVPCHTYDYELYLKKKEFTWTGEKKILFIDQDYPYAQDFKTLGYEVDAENYFRLINVAFDQIERVLKMPVVIAVHPRADYNDKRRPFGDRKLVYDDTVEQIAQSELVLGHTSTALGIAVAFNKPIVILASRVLYNISENERATYDGIAKYTGNTIKFIDETDKLDLKDAFEINNLKYNEFIEMFMRDKASLEEPYWDIISNNLEIR
jgi:hypothetical protein